MKWMMMRMMVVMVCLMLRGDVVMWCCVWSCDVMLFCDVVMWCYVVLWFRVVSQCVVVGMMLCVMLHVILRVCDVSVEWYCVTDVVDVGEVEWLILCCLGVLIYHRQTDGRMDICTFRVAFATEKSQNSIDMTKFASWEFWIFYLFFALTLRKLKYLKCIKCSFLKDWNINDKMYLWDH